jgi:hypothetical protein
MKYTMRATAASIKTVRETFSMQNTPGGHRLAGMVCFLVSGITKLRENTGIN